jgi:NTP pyrophosphatase (non-canonical NTP hydrolase)
MADIVETPVEEEAVVDTVVEEEYDPVFDQAPEEEETPAEEGSEAASEEETVEQPVVASHDPSMLERAAALMIPADEIAEMSPAELSRVIKHADRIGQTVYNSFQKPAPEAETPPPDEFAFLDDPEKYEQGFVQPIKAVLVKQADENKSLRQRLEKLEQTHAQTRQQTLHAKLMAHAAEVAPEVAKALESKGKFDELLAQMGVAQKFNANLTEKQLFVRAVKAMELVPEKPKENPAVAESKRKWDGAALGKPAPRNLAKTAEERVGEILQAANRKPVNGNGVKR